jgi:hypothetical protein
MLNLLRLLRYPESAYNQHMHRGGVAQLGERLVRNQKVVSSILITSTI